MTRINDYSNWQTCILRANLIKKNITDLYYGQFLFSTMVSKENNYRTT